MMTGLSALPALVAAAALFPLAAGPGPDPSAGRTLHLTLCAGAAGRTVDIPVPRRDPAAPLRCPPKACHAACNRRKFDPSQ
ncbi:hypothetical protein [Croceicoccus sp. YJ47]|uniref:hypothetical protein n=1 Tax=Croceicoccus sp. YJ47 TaxID=2798724 RepID=UPI001921FCB9|nr:hypothetical protein [Croceicoccus sp. YJ47]QQN74652.1 hypothetical protein JD971_02555 [Croceicoccus sp. YJ47]